MTDALDDVRDHYHAPALTERLKTALMALAPDERRLTPQCPSGRKVSHLNRLLGWA